MSRTYTFRLTVAVNGDHEAYDDPEGIADAAWGALKNVYGLECIYEDPGRQTEVDLGLWPFRGHEEESVGLDLFRFLVKTNQRVNKEPLAHQNPSSQGGAG